MNHEKIYEVFKNVKDKPNKDLIESLNTLTYEFEKTKDLIIDLTRHLDSVQEMYDVINDELGKRNIIK
jgi:hypothetical protein